ncbi:hypothetical protein SADO_14714 [Salinisphaera dokdonensis CL-ES53]|uniref:Type II secretion system protein GspB C-terminal domain-containing protein n=1 Tax=Salinisphaera dokdonensis CL-ES53 TaxID=1304272 RepID=A0ABV2B3Q2_9GAMM
MSYLVDALKKAERDRHENQRADLRSLAEGGAPTPGAGSGHALRWLVGLLVVCNAALLIYLFVPPRVSQAFVDTSQETPDQTARVEGNKAPRTVSQGGVPDQPAAAASQKSTTPSPVEMPRREAPASTPQHAQASGSSDVVKTRGGARTPDPVPSSPTLPPSNREGISGLRLSGEQARGGGRVTYSQTPLDGSARTNEAQAGGEVGGGSAPSVAINGHLYSTVPGRSFILVNGRRYHEGQRLAEGPAVETIDATGATLNYRGDRYHVKGPS